MAGNMPAYINSPAYPHPNQLSLSDLSLISNDTSSMNNMLLNVDHTQYTPERRHNITPCVSLIDVPSSMGQQAATQRSNRKSLNKQTIPRLAKQQTIPVSINSNNGLYHYNGENLPVNHHQCNFNYNLDCQSYIFPSTVEEALTNLNLLHYQKCFVDQEVDITVFLTLTEDDLREIGVERLGARRRILAYLNTLRSWKLSNMSNIVYNKVARPDSPRVYSLVDQTNGVTRQAMDDIMTNADRLLDCHKHLSREIVSNLAWADLSMRGDIQNWLRKMEDNAHHIQEAVLALKLNF